MLIQLLGKKETEAVLIPKTATVNGIYSARDYSADGFDVFTVAVPEPSGTLSISTNGIQDAKDYAFVDVNVPNGTETLTVTENNTYTPTSPNIGFNSVTVNVVPTIASLSITPSTSSQTFTPSGGTDGYGPVSVSAVDSGIDANIQAENIKDGVTILGVTGTLSTTKYDATVNCFLGDVDVNGVLQRPSEVTNLSFDGVKDIASGGTEKGALYYRFRNFTNIGTVSFPDLEGASTLYCMSGAFRGSSITSVSFPKLATASGASAMSYAFAQSSISSISFPVLTTVNGEQSMVGAFSQCTSLTSISFPSLTTISGYLGMYESFYGCTNLASISLPVLKTITSNGGLQNAFSGCRALTSVTFDALDTLNNSGCLFGCFNGCTSLQHIYFPALKSTSFGSYTDQFTNLVWGVDGCTIHFPANLDPQTGSTVISSLDQYPLFRGTNTTVLFDLPATE